jgi:hypothetical protein
MNESAAFVVAHAYNVWGGELKGRSTNNHSCFDEAYINSKLIVNFHNKNMTVKQDNYVKTGGFSYIQKAFYTIGSDKEDLLRNALAYNKNKEDLVNNIAPNPFARMLQLPPVPAGSYEDKIKFLVSYTNHLIGVE